MGLLTGDIAELVGSALVDADLAIPIILTKVTSTARNPATPTAATTPVTTAYQCKGFVASLAPFQIKGTLIKDANRVIKIYGSTLQGGVVPAPGDRITAESVTSTIVDNDGGLRAVTRDSAGAVWTVQAK